MTDAAHLLIQRQGELRSAMRSCPAETFFVALFQGCLSTNEERGYRALKNEIDQREIFKYETPEMKARTKELKQSGEDLLKTAKGRVKSQFRTNVESELAFRALSSALSDYKKKLKAYLDKANAHLISGVDKPSSPEELLKNIEKQLVPTKVIRFKIKGNNPSLEKLNQAQNEKENKYNYSDYTKYLAIAARLADANKTSGGARQSLTKSEKNSLERELKKLEKGFLVGQGQNPSVSEEKSILDQLRSIYLKKETQAEIRYSGLSVQSYVFFTNAKDERLENPLTSMEVTLSQCKSNKLVVPGGVFSNADCKSLSIRESKDAEKICSRYFGINLNSQRLQSSGAGNPK